MPHITELSEIQARAIACLMEKQLATPEQYPLTQNSLLLACNQKTNRNPVMNLSSGELGHALTELEGDGWLLVDSGSRASRYGHKVRNKLNLNLGAGGKAEQAILCMLMLRGPQTLSELNTRTAKIVNDDALIADRLDYLSQRSTPLLELQPKAAGQREARYAQLIFDAGDIQPMASTASKSSNPADTARIDQLEQDVAELQAQMKDLLAQLS